MGRTDNKSRRLAGVLAPVCAAWLSTTNTQQTQEAASRVWPSTARDSNQTEAVKRASSQNAGAIKPSADAAGGVRRNKQKSNNCHYEAMRPARFRSLPAHRQRYVDVQTRTRVSRVQLLCQSTVTGRLFYLSPQFTASVPLIKNILGLSKNDLSGPFSLHRYYRVHRPFGPGNNPLPLASTSQSKHPTGCCSILSPAR